MKKSIIFTMFLGVFFLFSSCKEKIENKKPLPFSNKMYVYKDNNKTVELLEFYGDDLIYTSMGHTPVTTYSFNSKTNILTVNEYRGEEIKDTSEYFYNHENDSFTLFENNNTVEEWILIKKKDFTADDIEQYKMMVNLSKALNK